MVQVFISYNHKDTPFARTIHDQMESWSVNAWIDIVDIHPGEEWDDAVHQGLKRSDVVVALLTPDSLLSRNVLDEWGYAMSNGKPLYLLWTADISEANMPPRYGRLQRIDLRRDQIAGLSQLRAVLEQFIARAAPSDTPPVIPSVTLRATLGTESPAATPVLKEPMPSLAVSITVKNLTGQTFQGYRIFEQVGSGGYGIVYRGNQMSIDREVAIKFVLPEYAEKPDFIQRFEAEAQVIARLEHPHIVPLYDYWRGGDHTAYLVMRLMRRGSLRAVLNQHGPLSLVHCTRMLDQIADALTFAHQAGVVHRDVKPDNVMLDELGNAYLGDFGIAKDLDHAPIIAGADQPISTPEFESPEEGQGQSATIRSDVYGFGRLIYESLGGSLSPVGMKRGGSYLIGSSQALGESRPNLPDALIGVIQKATASSPADRYPTIAEVMIAYHAAVDPLLFGNTQAVTPVQARTPIPLMMNAQGRELKNRRHMIQNVQTFWIKGVLENSLHGAALIELGLQDQLDAVANPWDLRLRPYDAPEEALPSQTRILDTFDRLNGKMLVLGDPGSGKTTTLLELARDLISRALNDPEHPIPVILNLSSWADERKPLTEWAVDELNSKYQVARKVGQDWIESDAVLFLLDGLDEVDLRYREACVEAINTYRQEHGFVDVVVCSRILDYQALTTKLQVNGAIVLQPLDADQIDGYLASLGQPMQVIRQGIREDATLRELAATPLMLSIMALTYQNITQEELPDTADVDTYRAHLFDLYIQRMFERRKIKATFTDAKTTHYLGWLASQLVRRKQTIFYIENMQIDWLESALNRNVYRILHYLGYGVGVGGLAGFVAGFVIGLFNTIYYQSTTHSAYSSDPGAFSDGFIGMFSGVIGGGLIFGFASLPALAIATMPAKTPKSPGWLPQLRGVGLFSIAVSVFLITLTVVLIGIALVGYQDPSQFSVRNLFGGFGIGSNEQYFKGTDAWLYYGALFGVIGLLMGIIASGLAALHRRGWLKSPRVVYGLYGALGGLLAILFLFSGSSSVGLASLITYVAAFAGAGALIGLIAGGYNDRIEVAENIGWRWNWRWAMLVLSPVLLTLLFIIIVAAASFSEAWNTYQHSYAAIAANYGQTVGTAPGFFDSLPKAPADPAIENKEEAALLQRDQMGAFHDYSADTSLIALVQKADGKVSAWIIFLSEVQNNLNTSWNILLPLALLGLLVGGIAGGLHKSETVEMRTRPNQGIRRTVRSTLRIVVIFGMVGLIMGVVSSAGWYIFYIAKTYNPANLSEQKALTNNVIGILSLGIGIGAAIGLILGGSDAVIKHLLLRFMLWRYRRTPRNYARLLNYAADRIFLRKVGGGYIFIHRFLLEHFADRYDGSRAQITEKLRAKRRVSQPVMVRLIVGLSVTLVIVAVFVPLVTVVGNTPVSIAPTAAGWVTCSVGTDVPLTAIQTDQGQPTTVRGCFKSSTYSYYGRSVTARLQPGQSDAWILDLDSAADSGTYTLMLNGNAFSDPANAGFDSVLDVYNIAGIRIAHNDDEPGYSYGYLRTLNSYIKQNKLPAGRYIVVIHDYANRGGEYTLSANSSYLLPTATPGPTKTPTTGKIAHIGDNRGSIPIGGGEEWQYNGVAGEMLTIQVNADHPANETSPQTRIDQHLLDPNLTIRDRSGTVIAFDDDIVDGIKTDSQIMNLILPYTGLYTFEVRSYGDNLGGAYTLNIISGPPGSTPMPTLTLMPDQTPHPTMTLMPDQTPLAP